MIKSVYLTNAYGESMSIKLAEPVIRDDGQHTTKHDNVFITEIEGLGPPKGDIRMDKSAIAHGSKFNSFRMESRDIIFHFAFLDLNGLSAEDGRLLIYRFFPIGEKVTIFVRTGNRYVRTTGRAESVEPDIFTELAGATVTVRCASAFFQLVYEERSDTYEMSNLYDSFEFAFSDEPTPSLIFTAKAPGMEHVIDYPGEAETGMIISIMGKGGMGSEPGTYKWRFPTIYNNVTREKMHIDTDLIESILNPNVPHPGPDWRIDIDDCTIGGDDELRISTVTGDKYARFYREGKAYSVLNALDLNTDWLTLHPGKNVFSYECEYGEYNIDISMTADILIAGV